MPSETVENYLKRTYVEQQDRRGELVPMGALANAMRVTPGTATSMVKALADLNLLEYEPRGGVRLTEDGSRLALQVLRRHRLIELFLVQTLKLDWSEVHEEAEVLEHAVSEKVLDRIDEMLGYPETDPHGDPIPPADATTPLPRENLASLVDCAAQTPLIVLRVLNQDPDFLQFIDQHDLAPGAVVMVTMRIPSADAITLQTAKGNAVTIGTKAAAKILVGNRP